MTETTEPARTPDFTVLADVFSTLSAVMADAAQAIRAIPLTRAEAPDYAGEIVPLTDSDIARLKALAEADFDSTEAIAAELTEFDAPAIAPGDVVADPAPVQAGEDLANWHLRLHQPISAKPEPEPGFTQAPLAPDDGGAPTSGEAEPAPADATVTEAVKEAPQEADRPFRQVTWEEVT